MLVFKTYMRVLASQLKTAAIYIAIFISISVAMSVTVSDESTGFADTKLKISVIDEDNSEASRALADYIETNHEIVEVENNTDKILDTLYYFYADVVLTIKEGYSDKLASGETDNLFSDYRVPGTFKAEFFDQQLNQYISTMCGYTASGLSVEEAAVRTAELSGNEVKVEIVNNKDEKSSGFSSSGAVYYQYLPYVLLAVIITTLCPTIITMTSGDINKRTNCSCVSSSSQITQIVAGATIFAVGIYLLLVIVSLILNGSVMLSKNGLLAIMNGFVFLIFSEMLAILISVMSPNQRVVSIFSNIFSLGMSFLCGVFVPQQLLSGTVLSIGRFLPAYWYIKANNMIAGTDTEILSTGSYLMCIGIQITFSVALFLLTILIARNKRSSKTV